MQQARVSVLLAVATLLCGTAGASEGPPAPTKAASPSIAKPRLKKKVEPHWPDKAVRAGLEASVRLDCSIGADGKVGQIVPLEGPQVLVEAATKAVAEWRYTPLLLNGTPTPFSNTVTFNLHAERPPKRADVVELATDGDADIRLASVRWLERLVPVTSEQRQVLERATKDESPPVREAASEALRRIDAR
jgi:TonB family protein